MDLFTHAMQDRMKSEAPLAARMRPRTLEEFVGQEDIVGPGRLLRRAKRCSITPEVRPPVFLHYPLGSAGHRQDHAGGSNPKHSQGLPSSLT
jgi:hypothetical protein